MRQTWAIMLDAYRELNAKKLFWITMAISAVVVLAFACVGMTPVGIKILRWEIETPFFNSALLPGAAFHKLMFQTFGVNFWLTWAATIIGLIATCSMIPDFVAGGSIELTLSKPVTRVRLFITKYVAGLLFTFLQVLVFTVAAFLVIGLRGGEWAPSLFLCVPIVTAAYSYLFSVCALVGLISRSAIFALIATLLMWAAIFAADSVERVVMLSLRTQSEVQVERIKFDLQRLEQADGESRGAEKEPPKGLLGRAAEMFKQRPLPESPAKLKGELVVAEKEKARWTYWHNVAFAVKTVLPKTAETTNLLERYILPDSQISKFRDAQLNMALKNQEEFREKRGAEPDANDKPEFGDARIAAEVDRKLGERSIAWVFGTSLLFEALMLGIGCWIFSRRDF